jgi:flagellar hook-associated protein 2
MAGLNIIGSYSGIDQSSIDKLMEAEKLPLVQLANKKTSITEKQNAWKDINTRLNSLFEKLKTLQSSETYTAKTTKSTNEDIVSMSASKNAAEGTYKINVQQLATSTSVISKEKVTSIVGGSFTIVNHEGNENERATIVVGENDTLQDVAFKINEASKDIKGEDGNVIKGTGIKASIIDNRLVLTDEKTGKRDITFTGDSDVLNSLHLQNASGDDIGKDAKFTINGVGVERSTNSVSDAVEGVTINLKKEHEAGKYDTITVSLDTSKLTKAIQDFVDQYNSTMTFIEDKLAPGTVTDSGTTGRGILAGDSGLQRLQSSLRNLVTSVVSKDKNEIQDISQLGVTTIDRYGQLQFDSSKLTKALSEDPKKVQDFFKGVEAKDGKESVKGYANKLSEFVNSYITSDKGIIKGKTEGFDKTLKDLNKQIDRFNARMVKKEAYYTKMFSALDVAMMQAESQMSWLEGQISAMNAQTAANKR